MPVETEIEDPRWSEAGLDALAERAVAATLAHLRLDPKRFTVSLLGCNDARIAALNGRFRGRAAPTNVLSWPSAERAAASPGVAPDPPDAEDADLGDIAVAFETCRSEAEAAGRTLAQHTAHLLVHGVLHLLGYDHIDDTDAALMEQIEVEILDRLGVANPY